MCAVIHSVYGNDGGGLAVSAVATFEHSGHSEPTARELVVDSSTKDKSVDKHFSGSFGRSLPRSVTQLQHKYIYKDIVNLV